MIKILLNGCCGRMGKTIARLADQNDGMEIVAGVDPFGEQYSHFPVFKSIDDVKCDADVIVDFSSPASLNGLLDYALSYKLPLVLATTGYTDEDIEKIKAASQNVPLFFTFNMSIGVNLIIGLSKKAAQVLGDSFDIEIIEKHHNMKKDAPSGTAIMLANAVNEVFDNQMAYEYDRHAKRGERPKKEIGIHSIRGGNIVGEHEVIFAGHDEQVSIKHIASSREVFAVGALKAAAFLPCNPPRIYDMNDLIK